jgi:hypothetical protein
MGMEKNETYCVLRNLRVRLSWRGRRRRGLVGLAPSLHVTNMPYEEGPKSESRASAMIAFSVPPIAISITDMPFLSEHEQQNKTYIDPNRNRVLKVEQQLLSISKSAAAS